MNKMSWWAAVLLLGVICAACDIVVDEPVTRSVEVSPEQADMDAGYAGKRNESAGGMTQSYCPTGDPDAKCDVCTLSGTIGPRTFALRGESWIAPNFLTAGSVPQALECGDAYHEEYGIGCGLPIAPCTADVLVDIVVYDVVTGDTLSMRIEQRVVPCQKLERIIHDTISALEPALEPSVEKRMAGRRMAGTIKAHHKLNLESGSTPELVHAVSKPLERSCSTSVHVPLYLD